MAKRNLLQSRLRRLWKVFMNVAGTYRNKLGVKTTRIMNSVIADGNKKIAARLSAAILNTDVEICQSLTTV